MGSLAKTVELASLPVSEDPDQDQFHGNVLWFGADGSVKLAHDDCGEVCAPPPTVWIHALMMIHPILSVGNTHG